MMKKITIPSLVIAFVLSSALWGFQSKASSDHKGELVKMDGLSAVYYVADNGNRYVFPNGKIYKSWFNNFDDVKTISREELGSITLAGNVLYRPGVVLIKTVTNSNVFAVSKNGKLRSVGSEANAIALYGEDWNKLVDDVPDSFFTNYHIGEEIDTASDFDPVDEMDNADSIEANFGLSRGVGKLARTKKCEFMNHVRHCGSDSNGNDKNDDEDNNDDNNLPDDGESPYIKKIVIDGAGSSGYIDAGDKITITFSEAVQPSSIHSDLKADGYVNSLDDDITASISVYADGVFEIKNISSFDLGEVENPGTFSVKMDLNSNSEILNITILAGNDIKITDEDFDDAKQIAGTIKDMNGNTMESDNDIGEPDGNFGGKNVNDGIEPYITSINVSNKGNNNYIDQGDEIKITFSEPVDPRSINSQLDEGLSVENVDSNDTGGIDVNGNGVLTIIDIASFSVGNVEDDTDFDVTLALNTSGNVLTITLTQGTAVILTDEDLDDAEQIGDVIEDKDDNEMDDDPNISDPTGSFIDDSSESDLYVDFIKAYDRGFAGYLDENDEIVITFSEEIDRDYIDLGNNIEHDESGGVHVSLDGILTVTDILTFDIGEVEEARNFEVSLSLSTSNKVLTIKLTEGDAVKIKKELFSNTDQIGGYMVKLNDDNVVMSSMQNIDNPNGTFGGDSNDSPPYITKIEVQNGSDTNKIDLDDKIIVTFNEAIDPSSIDNDLELDDYITNVDDDDTGGVIVTSSGILTITDIAKFYIGSVEDDGEFDVKLELNEIGNILTITLESGDDIEITYEDLDDAEQLGGIIEDTDNNEMVDDPRIDDPDGSF